jgi:endonuclease G
MKKLLYVILCAFLCSCSNSSESSETEKQEWELGGRVISGRLEIPRLKDISGIDQFIDHSTTLNGQLMETYCMEYNYIKFHSRWIAFYITQSNAFSGNGVVRSDYGGGPGFVVEPELATEYQTNKSDYNPNYDRGHLCASADRFYSQEANNQTFYYSNMSPQLNAFNAGIWMHLESKVRSWGYNRDMCDTLFIAKGGTINSNDMIQTYTTTGKHKVAVPKYYFMALLSKKGNAYQAIGFLLEHKSNYPKSGFGFQQYAMTIKELEKRTKIDFFPNLSDDMESKVESIINQSFWKNLNADN